GEQRRPPAEVDPGGVALTLEALDHDIGPVLLLGAREAGRDRQPHDAVALHRVDRLSPAGAANDLDLHVPIKAGGRAADAPSPSRRRPATARLDVAEVHQVARALRA